AGGLGRSYRTIVRERAGVGHVHRYRLTDEPVGSVEHRDVVGHRPAGQLLDRAVGAPAVPARTFDQHLDRLADPGPVVGQAVRVLDGEQVVVPPLLDLLRHVVRVPVGRL